jgi:integrase
MSRNKDTYRLWQHANGIYYVIWTERTPTGSGEYRTQSKRVSTWTTDRKAAEQYRAQFIAELNNPAPPAEPTIGYLLDRYQKEHGVNTRSPVTIDCHLKVLKPFFGDLLPCHVTNKLLRQYAEERNRWSAGTILRQLGTLRAALKFAEGNRWIAPMPTLRMPVGHPPPRDVWLTREQVGLLLEKAKSPHVRLFILLAVSTAARSGALLDLTWPQVDLKTRIIDFGRGWGNKRRAIVPMNSDIHAALTTAKEVAQSDYVIEYYGKQIACVRLAFTRLCKECGMKASPHVLRHTAATWLVTDGVPLSEVARLLGNSEAMVERVYGKHTPDYLRRAVNVLNLSKPKILQVK